jgi:hypothetical protein
MMMILLIEVRCIQVILLYCKSENVTDLLNESIFLLHVANNCQALLHEVVLSTHCHGSQEEIELTNCSGGKP